MQSKTRLTADEVALIVDHVTPMLDGVTRRLENLPRSGDDDVGNYIKNQRAYLRHVRGGLRWVIGVAKQRGVIADGYIREHNGGIT